MVRPGFDPRRLVKLMNEAINRCKLDLRELTVLTEAATGAYSVTPVLCAMAGAKKVFAITASSRFGTVEEVVRQTKALAQLAGLANHVSIITEKSKEVVERADIVTNSGHVRPIDETMIGWMKPSAVISLMYEAWELRASDVDLEACRRRNIMVGGINERHVSIDVFSYLSLMASKLLMDAGVAVSLSNILLICDCPFRESLERGLIRAGASVDTVEDLPQDTPNGTAYDAMLVALGPQSKLELSPEKCKVLADRWPGVVVAQFIGDIDRTTFRNAGISVWPPEAPSPGHMGILPSDIGPEPIIRLQAGGLKVGELLARRSSCSEEEFCEYVQPIFA